MSKNLNENENDILKGVITNPSLNPSQNTKAKESKLIVGDSKDGDSKSKSFVDQLYDQITAVIGGSNPNQFFCMSLPGTIIDKTQYLYDIDNNEPKPAYVEANESKLVNKLFDACTLSSSSNGRHLQTQYRSALDMLTPRLNSKLFEAKTQLRKLLMTPYPYKFDDGTPFTGLTLQQVFYKLYGVYVSEKQVWAKMKLDKKNELQKKYPGSSAEENRKKQNDYLDWYETIAEPQLLKVEEKLGKVLNVFSPGDMEIISGILDIGSGREISESRESVTNVEKLNPDGGYVYPVNLYPENWFKLLDTSFTNIDLLESPAASSQKMFVLTAQRNNITTKINTLLTLIPNEEDVKSLKSAYDESTKAYQETFDELTKVYTSATIDMVKSILDAIPDANELSKEKPSSATESITKRTFGVKADGVKGILDILGKNAQKCLDSQMKLNKAANQATDSAIAYFEKNNNLQYKQILIPLQSQLQSTNDEITELQQKIKLAATMQSQSSDNKSTADVMPNSVPDSFTQIIITSKLSEVNQRSSSNASASKSSYGVSFFFGGYSSSSSHNQAVSSAFSSQSDMEIQIGMSLAKVEIGREWFNPGIFLLTSDMYNTSNEKIAPSKDYTEFTSERFNEMNKCVFPCFPTAFVIAKDITIKFNSSTSLSDDFAQSIEEHSSHSGGFFIFGGNNSSASKSSSSNSVANSSANSVSVKFTNPQILGYYLEATPSDKSVNISTVESGKSDFISIFDFITDFQKMLDDYNKTYNKNILNMEI